MSRRDIEELARQLVSLDQRHTALARATQLNNSSVRLSTGEDADIGTGIEEGVDARKDTDELYDYTDEIGDLTDSDIDYGATVPEWLVGVGDSGDTSWDLALEALEKAENVALPAAPKAPTNVTVSENTGVWTKEGPFAEVVVTWDAVTEDQEDKETTIKAYGIYYALAGKPVVQQAEVTSPTFSVLLPADTSYDLQVVAIGELAGIGDLSDKITFTTEIPEVEEFKPSKPSVISTLGVAQVGWDGVSSVQQIAPISLLAVAVEVRLADEGGSFGDWEEYSRFTSKGRITFRGDVGTQFETRLVAYDKLQRPMGTSEATEGIIESIPFDVIDVDLEEFLSSNNERVDKFFEVVNATNRIYPSVSPPGYGYVGITNYAPPLVGSGDYFSVPRGSFIDDDDPDFELDEVTNTLRAEKVAGFTGTAVAIISSIGNQPALRIVPQDTDNDSYVKFTIPEGDIRNEGHVYGSVTVPEELEGVLHSDALRITVENPLQSSEQLDDLQGIQELTVSYEELTETFEVKLWHGGDRDSGVVRWAEIYLSNIPVDPNELVRINEGDIWWELNESETSVIAVHLWDGISEWVPYQLVADTILAANSITSPLISAGAIEVSHLSPSVGNEIEISGNVTITSIEDELSEQQDTFRVTAEGASIVSKDSSSEFRLTSSGAEIRQGGVVASKWEAARFIVPKIEIQSGQLANHVVEKSGEQRTIFRPII